MKEQEKIRTILFYKNYFKEFYIEQPEAVRRKINYSMSLVETQRIVPKNSSNSWMVPMGYTK